MATFPGRLLSVYLRFMARSHLANSELTLSPKKVATLAALVFLTLLLLLFFCCFQRRRGQSGVRESSRNVSLLGRSGTPERQLPNPPGTSASAALVTLATFAALVTLAKHRLSPKSPTPAAGISQQIGAEGAGEAGTSASKDDLITTSSAMEVERDTVVFVKAAGAATYCNLEDLLYSSAELLGRGSVGTSYEVEFQGNTVVVKRLRGVVADKREFEMQMEVLGNCCHENVVPLIAYYFSKDEKLLLSEYFASGSLSSFLHGSRGSGKTPLDWVHRMKIAVATARGLTYLHVSGKVIHGNIKSSNILLRLDKRDAAVSDYGLNPLFDESYPTNRMVGYPAPEVVESRRVSFKSDVYNFGVLLLELLSGKEPNEASSGEHVIDLVSWVQSVVREEWTVEVFDIELMRYNNVEEKLVQLLQIAMACVHTDPNERPEMPEVLRMMEDINKGDTDGGLRQSSDDLSKGYEPSPFVERTSESTMTP